MLGLLVVAVSGDAASAIECVDRSYRITVVTPAASSRDATVCELGELASWLHLTPETSISFSTPAGDLGPLYVVGLDVVEGTAVRRLVQLRLYPRAPGAPVVFVAAPGFIESEPYTGSVSRGWRTLDPGARVPAGLADLGVPQRGTAEPSDPTTEARRSPGPDAVSVAFLGSIAAAVAIIVLRRRTAVRP